MKFTTLFALVALFATSLHAATERPLTFHELTANTIDGEPKLMADYRGAVLLVVNTASQCGFTPQYAGLQELHERYQDRGLVILGFPSNDFGGQEPGTPAQIKTFCEKRYRVTFPMFEKVATRGRSASPIYRFLAAHHGEPQWNFHKYIVGKDGQVTAAFPSSVAPDNRDLVAAIEAALRAEPTTSRRWRP